MKEKQPIIASTYIITQNFKLPKPAITLSSQIRQAKKKFNTVKKGQETTTSTNLNSNTKKREKMTLSSPIKLEKSPIMLSFGD